MLEMVTIAKIEYERLQKDSELLEFLFSRGVDNWSGYATPPDRKDYETDEEYEEAYENACMNW